VVIGVYCMHCTTYRMLEEVNMFQLIVIISILVSLLSFGMGRVIGNQRIIKGDLAKIKKHLGIEEK